MGSFMDYYLPKFSTFLKEFLSQRSLFTVNTDYIIPIESKGAMLLNSVIGNDGDDIRGKVVHSRALDYIDPSMLKNKFALLVDDVAVSGRTLEDYKQRLHRKGIKNVQKLAFIKHPNFDAELEEAKRRKEDINNRTDINFGFPVDRDAYHAFAMEIAKLSLNERPSYPDHFKVAISFDRVIEPEDLDGFGTLIRYNRSKYRNEWSIHYPFLELNDFKSKIKHYDSAFKIRLSNSAKNPYKWKICPVVFPSLERQPKTNELDELETEYYKVLHKDWHDSSTLESDLYESITLSDRVKSIAGLLNYLEDRGIFSREIGIDTGNLRKYYGPEISGTIEKFALEKLRLRKGLRVSFQNRDQDFEMNKIPELRIPIIALLDEKYETHPDNVGKANWDKSPVGLTVKEIAEELKSNLITTSIACEAVNDYGYIVPMIQDNSRKYRDSEIGKELLRYEAR